MKNKNLTTKNTNPNLLKRQLEKMFKAKGRKLFKAIKWQIELWTNPLYHEAEKIVVAAGTSGGKSTALAGYAELNHLLKKMDVYYRKESKNRKKTLLCPASTHVLKDNMAKSFSDFKPTFKYKVCNDRNDLENAINGEYDVIIALPQLCISNVDILPKTDLFILDEAHQWYFAKKGKGTIHQIIEKTNPTQQILLTGTPFKFQRADRKDKFTFLRVTVFDLMDEGLVSKPKVEIVSTPSYNFNNTHYNGNYGDLKSGQTKNKKKIKASLEDVLFDMVAKLYYNNDNTILKNKNNLGIVSELWNKVGKMLNEMHKTIIFCDSREQADEFGKILNEIQELKNKILVSHSDNDPTSENFLKFQNQSDVKILIAVDRGRLGYNVEELFNVVDFTFTQNLEMLMQMFGRLLRLSQTNPGKTKIYYKVATSETAEYFSTLMLGMFHLFHKDWYERFDGKNMGQILVPKIRTNSGNKKSNGPKKSNSIKPKVNIANLELLDIDVYYNVLHKNNDLFTTIKWTTLDNVRREFFNINGHNHFTKNNIFRYEEAKNIVAPLKISSYKEWYQFTKTNEFRNNPIYERMPAGVMGYYKRTGEWVSSFDFFGYSKNKYQWSADEIFERVKNYKTLKDFRELDKDVHQAARRKGSEFFEKVKNMLESSITYWDFEKCKETALRYHKFSEFAKNEASCCGHARENGFLDEITSHMYKVDNVAMTLSEFNKIVKENNLITKQDLRTYKGSNLRKVAYRLGIWDNFPNSKRGIRTLPQSEIDEVKKVALKYKRRTDFKRGNSRLYQKARFYNIIDDVCKHMISNKESWLIGRKLK